MRGWLIPLAFSVMTLPVARANPTGIAELTVQHSAEVPQSERDYYSVQIATSPSEQVLQRQFARYARLPWLRIERRGTLHVLRGGFWSSEATARAAVADFKDVLGSNPLVRMASYRPEMIVRGNGLEAKRTQVPEKKTEPNMVGKEPAGELLESQAVLSASPATQPRQPSHPTATMSSPVPAVPEAEKSGMRPYDAEDYALAYDTFLGSGDRERAFLVASKAVASVPHDLEWRRKLARVADWTQRPAIAWAQWSMLFQQGDRSAETQTAVLRLAPFFDEPVAAIEVWKARVQGAGGAALTDAQWQDLYNLFEAASQPRAGSLFFEQQYRRLGKVKLLEYAAQESENVGDDDRALRLFSERIGVEPFDQEACLHAAIILLRRDREREAYTLLEAQRDRASVKEAGYWNLLTNMALNLAELKVAESAMQQLNAGTLADNADWNRLIALLRLEHPARAADLSMERYRRTGQMTFFINALEFYSQTDQRSMQTRLLAGLSAEARTALEKDVRFLRLRARYYQLSRDPVDASRAWHDLQHALALQPGETETVVTMLWFLLDQHRLSELPVLLQRYGAQAEKNSAFWLVYASAYHGLDQYRKALPWYRKEIGRTPEDTLLLLNYADLLDRLQRQGMAERVRRHAWLRLREKFPQPALNAPLDPQPELLALARLALQNNPGDSGQALLRKLVTELRGLPVESSAASTSNAGSVEDQQTRDLVSGWAISHELHPEARAWMWLSQVRSQATQGHYRAPLWAEAQAALQLNDTQRMDRLLNEQGAALPIYNRYDIAHALEHWPQAQNIAFRGMHDNEVDEELYDRYRQHAPRHLNYLQGSLRQATYGALESREQRAQAHLVVSRRLHLDLDWEGFAQSSRDPSFATPSRERLARVGVQWLGTHGDTTLSVFQRNELGSNTGWRATQNWTWNQRLSLNGAAEYRGEATDSLPLRVAGQQSSLSLGMNYALSRREYVAATQRFNRYSTQLEESLGSSRTLDAEAGYRIRLEYPDWRTRLFATTQSFSYNTGTRLGAQTLAALSPSAQTSLATGAVDAAHYFLPQGSTTLGACLSMGENLAGQNLQETYTRAWRPFYDLCTSRNSVNGAGYSGYIGMAGSLDGEDHLSLRLEQSNGGTGAGTLSRMLTARYRHYF